MATPLDEMLVSLCGPERLLDLARRFTLFEAGARKVARHQQFFAVKDLLRRVEARDGKGHRAGVVVWRTQGSGKSLTMVMLAKALSFSAPTARIVLVTNRTDLDDQIDKTFKATDLSPERAKTGESNVAGQMTFLVTEFGKPFTAAGFGNWFREQCNVANLRHCSAHGLRKAAARRMAEAGCTEHEIAAITGHASLREIVRYTRAADQRRLATAAMEKVKARTPSVKPVAKSVKKRKKS